MAPILRRVVGSRGVDGEELGSWLMLVAVTLFFLALTLLPVLLFDLFER